MLRSFNTKDIVFIAILSAALTLVGVLVMPLVMSYTLFGLRNMASAFFYSIFIIIGLMKIPKVGTLTLIGLFHGSVLLMIAPVMFFTMFLGAVLGEIIMVLIYRDYSKDSARILTSTLYIPMTFPMTLAFTVLIHGKTFGEIVENPFATVVLLFLSLGLSYLGSRVGYKISLELKRAGKL